MVQAPTRIEPMSLRIYWAYCRENWARIWPWIEVDMGEMYGLQKWNGTYDAGFRTTYTISIHLSYRDGSTVN